jgi:hypothetical protein
MLYTSHDSPRQTEKRPHPKGRERLCDTPAVPPFLALPLTRPGTGRTRGTDDTRALLTMGESGQVYWLSDVGASSFRSTVVKSRSIGGSRRIFDGVPVSGFHHSGRTLCTFRRVYSFPSQPMNYAQMATCIHKLNAPGARHAHRLSFVARLYTKTEKRASRGFFW